jgi:hypothetical protein
VAAAAPRGLADASAAPPAPTLAASVSAATPPSAQSLLRRIASPFG